jgi:mevalonate kinase
MIPHGSGLGTSAAWHALHDRDAIEEELESGAGWQDPVIIHETGLCCWASGPRPALIVKDGGDWLAGKLALYWTGQSHKTCEIVDRQRDYNQIANASVLGFKAVDRACIHTLAAAIDASYEAQLGEGMEPLPAFGLAAKYCGAGWGGYAVYLFETRAIRDRAVEKRGLMPVEPYCK